MQHRVWREREKIRELYRQGAIFFLCGDGQYMAPAVRENPGWAPLAELAGDAATALAGLDAQLRRAVAGAREWLGGEQPTIRWPLLEMFLVTGRFYTSTCRRTWHYSRRCPQTH